jgi:hypothetical protein
MKSDSAHFELDLPFPLLTRAGRSAERTGDGTKVLK